MQQKNMKKDSLCRGTMWFHTYNEQWWGYIYMHRFESPIILWTDTPWRRWAWLNRFCQVRHKKICTLRWQWQVNSKLANKTGTSHRRNKPHVPFTPIANKLSNAQNRRRLHWHCVVHVSCSALFSCAVIVGKLNVLTLPYQAFVTSLNKKKRELPHCMNLHLGGTRTALLQKKKGKKTGHNRNKCFCVVPCRNVLCCVVTTQMVRISSAWNENCAEGSQQYKPALAKPVLAKRETCRIYAC